MKRPRSAFACLLIALAALLSACGLPLGPGYTVKRQQLEVRSAGDASLHIRGAYRLQNTGKGPLDYIEVTLPEEPRRAGLQVSLDRSPVAAQPADARAPAGTVRIPISPALPQKKKRDLVIEYQIEGAFGDTLELTTFYLPAEGWYPALRPREGLLGSGGDPPQKWDLRVTVPREFLVHASGQPKGKKRRKESVEHRFRQRRDRDFHPFVMAGRMSEYRTKLAGNELVLWSKDPLPAEKAGQTLDRVAAIVRGLQDALGPFSRDRRDSLLFAQGGVATSSGQSEIVTFPGAVWMNWPLFDEPPSCMSDAFTARLWFFHMAQPEPEAEALAATLSDHAPALAAGGCEHRLPAFDPASFVQETLRAFDREQLESESNPNRQAMMARESFKLALFVVALEEKLGRAALNASLKRMLQALRGRTWTTNDLRVAIQLETGEDPAEFFRLWLNQPGIPDDFRQRYQATK